MKPASFAYHRPTTVAEAVATLDGYGGTARVLAGGQSLVPMLNMRLWRPAAVVDINDIDDLDDIHTDGDRTEIGALVRYSTVERSALLGERVPLLARAVRSIGDRQVRNRGTVCGSLVHAGPTAEAPLACLALDAVVVAAGVRGLRRVPVAELYEGAYATVLDPEELVVAVELPPHPTHWVFHEIHRKHNDFAVLALAVAGSTTRARGDGTACGSPSADWPRRPCSPDVPPRHSRTRRSPMPTSTRRWRRPTRRSTHRTTSGPPRSTAVTSWASTCAGS